MARPRSTQIITANALVAGDVLYLDADDQWSRDIADADLLSDEADAQLRLLWAVRQPDVVGAYLADAKLTATGPAPVHFREIFRANGPTNYRHGKQERVRHV